MRKLDDLKCIPRRTACNQLISIQGYGSTFTLVMFTCSAANKSGSWNSKRKRPIISSTNYVNISCDLTKQNVNDLFFNGKTRDLFWLNNLI